MTMKKNIKWSFQPAQWLSSGTGVRTVLAIYLDVNMVKNIYFVI